MNAELLFKALSDPTRQRLLRVLGLHELNVNELVEVLGQPQSTISRHLKVLREAGLIADRRTGTTSYYSTVPTNGTGGGEPPAGENRQQTVALISDDEPAVGLRNRLMEWVRSQPLDSAMQDRLNLVLARRKPTSQDFFEDMGGRWDQMRVEAFGPFFHQEALIGLLDEDWVVADVGTGTGYLLPVLARCFPRVIAIDPADTMLAAARARTAADGVENVEFREGSLENLPLENGEVDLIAASLVLHHVARPAQSLEELRRTLRPGGRLLLVEQKVHHHAGFHERMGDYWWGFDPGQLARWLQEAGFERIRSRPLQTVQPIGRYADQVPELYVVTARAATDKHRARSNVSRGQRAGQSSSGFEKEDEILL